MTALRGRFVTFACAVLGALASTGCGASSRAAGPDAARTGQPAPPPPTAGTPPRADELPTLDVLAARGATDAPLMRELLRLERAAPRSADIRAERDLCVRATFAASAPVRAWFADASGAPSGEPAGGTAGSVPPRGPVCVKKGEALHLVVEGAGARDIAARAVVFAAP